MLTPIVHPIRHVGPSPHVHRMPYTSHDGASYPNLHSAFPNAHFYEYTKMPYSIMAKNGIPDNLHHGPATFDLCGQTWPTVDGDVHDARFLDPALLC